MNLREFIRLLRIELELENKELEKQANKINPYTGGDIGLYRMLMNNISFNLAKIDILTRCLSEEIDGFPGLKHFKGLSNE